MKIQFDFSERIEKYGMIFISIFINDKQAVMLLDTGCIGNIIDYSFLKKNNIDVPKLKRNLISGLNYERKIRSSFIELKDVNIENIFNSDIKFLTIDFSKTAKSFEKDYGIEMSGILGNDFLSKNNIIINYKNKTIEYENNN